MDHFRLLTAFLVLLAGTWGLYTCGQTARRHRQPYLKSLFIMQIILFCSYLLTILSKYSDLNIGADFLSAHIPHYHQLIFIAILPLLTALIFLIVNTLWQLMGQSMPRWMSGVFFVCTAMILLILSFSLLSGRNRSPNYILIAERIGDLLFLYFIAILLWLYHRSRRLPDPQVARLIRGYLWIFSSPLLLFLLLIPISPLLSADSIWVTLFKRLLGLWVISLPTLWIRWFFLPYSQRLSMVIEKELDLDALCQQKGVSSREQEILRLLLDGKSNREIEALLFISFHTVKNHIYNLYRKFNVSSRHQLFHLLSVRRRVD